MARFRMAAMLKIIAERAGLSQAAVSQILNRKANDFSSEETRRRVFAIAGELGYKQKFGHKLLRGDKTQTVGILLPMHRIALEEHMQALIIMLLDKLERKGYGSYFVTLAESEEKNLQLIRDLVGRGVDCFIVLGEPVGERKIEQEIVKNGRTVIGYLNSFRRTLTQSITQSCCEILRFFLDEGRTNFRFLLGSPLSPGNERFLSLKQVFSELTDAEIRSRYYVELGRLGEHDDIDLYARIGYEKTRETLEQDPSVSAIFYLSDYFAIGGVRYLLETGRKIGSDVLVAGFNNIHAIRNSFFPISSVEHALPEITDALVEEMTGTGEVNRAIRSRTIIRKV